MWIFRAWITGRDGEKINSKEALYQLGVSGFKKGARDMAKTKSSVRGTQQKKIVVVKSYTRSDGTKVDGHRRSTPN